MANECGACSVCCKLLPIPEIDKPANVWCEHFVKGIGCGIYEDRPDVCRGFQCSYLADELPEEMRPDRLGILIVGRQLDLEDGRVMPGVGIYERHHGAAKTPLAQSALTQLALRYPCTLFSPEGTEARRIHAEIRPSSTPGVPEVRLSLGEQRIVVDRTDGTFHMPMTATEVKRWVEEPATTDETGGPR